LDEEAILKSLKQNVLSTAEEHNIFEVLESISRVLALNNPVLKSLLLLMTVSVSLEHRHN
jgi:hypothetical protein